VHPEQVRHIAEGFEAMTIEDLTPIQQERNRLHAEYLAYLSHLTAEELDGELVFMRLAVEDSKRFAGEE